jgi:thiol reductant ABC exporter CydD subunit
VAIGLGLTLSLLAQALLLARLLGWAMSSPAGPFPTTTTICLVLALGARALLGGLSDLVAAHSGRRVTEVLRHELLGGLRSLGPVGLSDQKTGALALSATRGLRSLEPYFSRYLPAAIVAALAPPLALLTLGVVDWPSCLVALGLLVFVPFAMVRLGRRAARESERQWRRLSSLSGRILELLRGLPTLRALGQVDLGRREVEAASSSVAQSIDETLRTAMLSTAALEFLAGVGVGLVAMLAGLRLLHGSITVVTALTVILLTPEVYLPLRRAGAEFHASTEGRAAAEGIFTLLDAAPEPRLERIVATSVTPIILEAVTARYPGAQELALAPCTLSLEAGERLVVRGASGAGKSTLLALLCGFLEPDSGSLQIGSLRDEEISTDAIAGLISYVPQTPHVFAGSIRENLTFGRAAQDEVLLEVLNLVGLRHLASLPGGLSRILAERGRSLSGGERQRLGLARAVLQDRPVLLLDEPTAHLDELSIEALGTRLDSWLSARTVVEVAHRPCLLREPTRQLRLVPPEVGR